MIRTLREIINGPMFFLTMIIISLATLAVAFAVEYGLEMLH